MVSRTRKVIIALGAVYVAVGVLFGAVFGAIPAHTLAGQAYVAATWPAWVKGSPVHIGIPSWGFHFDDNRPPRQATKETK